MNPPKVSVMSCIVSPAQNGETCDVSYGDGSVLRCALGATAFIDARKAYELLTPYERERADRTTVVYTTYPFIRNTRARNSPDGLRCYGNPEDIPDGYDENQQNMSFPLVWQHPVTGRKALMAHPRCLERFEISRPEISEESHENASVFVVERDQAREYLYTLMRRAAEPELVYAHQWHKGDVGLWDNHVLWHSTTGGLREQDKRLMHLTSFDATEPPRGPVNSKKRKSGE
eukprot:gnl/MRDRNA2_/MRDRNA2_222274_c0_seq1.p1 gnl/MRDRNA2_/MRDRNA2_222274_c0~~gnl/MRDRNA2_/MRDRNA2_222274_c0_seq1.p1  ORF type:complete len:243 (+),score=36.66 gnl/MRDRNA2_/MRDRNA2_222274_c0_seq1:38-730(+)